MLKSMALRVVVLAIAFVVVDALTDSVTVTGGFFAAMGLAVIYGLVSGVLGTLLRLLTLPVVLLTAGLFELVINAVLLLVTDSVTDSLEIDSFLAALGASVVFAVVSTILGFVLAPFKD